VPIVLALKCGNSVLHNGFRVDKPYYKFASVKSATTSILINMYKYLSISTIHIFSPYSYSYTSTIIILFYFLNFIIRCNTNTRHSAVRTTLLHQKSVCP
jgi:hypothetical protein